MPPPKLPTDKMSTLQFKEWIRRETDKIMRKRIAARKKRDKAKS